MAEYIEREAALAFKYHSGEYDSRTKQFNLPVVDVYDILEIPAADVQPVRHGRWVKKHDDVCYWHECSECGERLPLNHWRQPWKSPYCPNCGAKLDGGE